jgi:hypothetical protein
MRNPYPDQSISLLKRSTSRHQDPNLMKNYEIILYILNRYSRSTKAYNGGAWIFGSIATSGLTYLVCVL